MHGLGGGSYQTRPGLPGTQWRVRATDDDINTWCVLELEFYADNTCLTSKIEMDMFNSAPI